MEDEIIRGIYTGEYSIFNLPSELYTATFTKLMGGVLEGMGTLSIETPAFELALYFEQNINIFSGAKTFKNIWDMQKVLISKEGFIQPFKEFKKVAQSIYAEYNKNYLLAEYDTALGSAQMGSQWLNLENDRDVFPLLQYVTVGDNRVRPSHAAMDGIIKPVDDPFWNDFYPLNGYRCRCQVIQLESGRVTKISKEKQELIKKDVPELFKMNAGKDKLIFHPNHPYWSTKGLPPPVKEVFKKGLSNNFGLQKPVIKKLEP